MENTTNISIPMIPLEPAINTAEIKAETLINLTAHFYKLFKDKGVINRFEPFLKDCKEQAMQRVNINEMLIFKDLEVLDSDFDSGMGVIPNEPPIIENDTSSGIDSQDKSTTQELDTESEVLLLDTEVEKDKDKAQGSDVIVSTEIGLKPV